MLGGHQLSIYMFFSRYVLKIFCPVSKRSGDWCVIWMSCVEDQTRFHVAKHTFYVLMNQPDTLHKSITPTKGDRQPIRRSHEYSAYGKDIQTTTLALDLTHERYIPRSIQTPTIHPICTMQPTPLSLMPKFNLHAALCNTLHQSSLQPYHIKIVCIISMYTTTKRKKKLLRQTPFQHFIRSARFTTDARTAPTQTRHSPTRQPQKPSTPSRSSPTALAKEPYRPTS